jgi:hypothetical protein
MRRFRWSWASFNLITDLWIFFLPLPVISKLHTNRATKIGLSLIFLLGLFVCITTAIRMKTLVQSVHAVDQTFDSGPAYIWSFTESAVGLIIACLPSLKRPLGKCIPHLLTSRSRSRKTSNYYKYGGGYNMNAYPKGSHGSNFGGKLSKHSKGTSTVDKDDVQSDEIKLSPEKNTDGNVTITAYPIDHHSRPRNSSEERILGGINVQREISVRSSPAFPPNAF